MKNYKMLLYLIVVALVSYQIGKSYMRLTHDAAKNNGVKVLYAVATTADTLIGISDVHTETSDDENAPIADIDGATERAYLKRFAAVAVTERRKFGIPASLILATAFLQSHAGTRPATTQFNNHFGVTKTFDWTGATGTSENKEFRMYENAWVSFRDFSLYVTTGKYAELRKLTAVDAVGWAEGLQRLGFADNPTFADDISGIIERFGLQKLDAVK